MAKLRDFAILNWSGGVVRNKSDFEMDRNELRHSVNFDVDERGRLTTRRGYQRFSTDAGSTTIDNIFSFTKETTGSSVKIQNYLMAIDRSNDAIIYRVVSASVGAAISVGDTTITINAPSVADFSASGSVEIEGDIIAYSGKSGGTLTGVTGILKAHAAGVPIRQTVTLQGNGSTSIDSRGSIEFSVLNNTAFLVGDRSVNNGVISFDGTTFTPEPNSPAGVFNKIYRQRLYTVGNAKGAASPINPQRRRVSYSYPGDATSTGWTTNNYFDAEDDRRGEEISGLWVLNDRLLIFKPNSMWAYDEVKLEQNVSDVGAYNQRVIQEIDGKLYTFCPSGVFVTNGYAYKKISVPVGEYLRSFMPRYDSSSDRRIIFDTFAWTFEKKYHLFIGNITIPETITNAVLVYDTVTNSWAVYSNMAFSNVVSFLRIPDEAHTATTGDQSFLNTVEASIGMDSTGTLFRLFDSRAINQDGTKTGGDILADNIDDSAGSPISAHAETAWLDLGSPSWWKKFGKLRVMVEQGSFSISYKLDQGTKETDWIPLGEFSGKNVWKRFREDEGYRIKLAVSSNQLAARNILNGIIVEDTEALNKQR